MLTTPLRDGSVTIYCQKCREMKVDRLPRITVEGPAWEIDEVEDLELDAVEKWNMLYGKEVARG